MSELLHFFMHMSGPADINCTVIAHLGKSAIKTTVTIDRNIVFVSKEMKCSIRRLGLYFHAILLAYGSHAVHGFLRKIEILRFFDEYIFLHAFKGIRAMMFLAYFDAFEILFVNEIVQLSE